MNTPTYLSHAYCYRKVATVEVDILLTGGNTLLLLDKDGMPRHLDKPLEISKKKSEEEVRALWRTAAAEGRVYVLHAYRWTGLEELPAVPDLPLITPQPASIPS